MDNFRNVLILVLTSILILIVKTSHSYRVQTDRDAVVSVF